ncbi:acetoacetate--CoA ligase [Bacillus massiliigorillae]|uniref:acetoacetate--CoA ligase n=1 Tax=Bacillus massiliigorillae TaxID=1243664 RepID=UPI0003A9221A|nr:acetoacetate--CoA ligase [Bacillus massiliigorillae]
MVTEGTLLWQPNNFIKENAYVSKYMEWLRQTKGLQVEDYQALYRWSVNELELFWKSIWEYFDIQSSTPYEKVLVNKTMPGAKWFQGSHVNFAQHVLRQGETNKVAIHHQSEIRGLEGMTWDELKKQVLIIATELRIMGVQPGDRVAAYLPNIPEAVVAMLASMSIGAVWTSCSPDFGNQSVLDRLQQIEPKVLFAVDGYKYGGQSFDRRVEVQAIIEQLPSLKEVVYVTHLYREENQAIVDAKNWSELLNQPEIPFSQFRFEGVPFDHPLSIMYSSGTTGIPKAIVHSHGGMLLEAYKVLSLHANLGPESCIFFYTSTGWMMFNILTYALLTGSAIVLYDGNPGYPHLGTLWEIAEKTKTTMFGASPMYVNLMKKVGLSPKEKYNLSHMQSVMLSGAPSGPEIFEWIYQHVKQDLWLTSQSGGTDICSGFVTGIPIEPVYAGEMQVRALGVDVHAYSDEGETLIDEVGELVVLQPMPSMPIYFWNDDNNERLNESYFETFADIWRHGDYLKITSRGTCIIYGRSDSTLNRNGVRMGTSEIYSAVESLEQVQDSMIVNLDLEGSNSFMPLFVVLKQGAELDNSLKKKIKESIRTHCSPRHVPDGIFQIVQVPYTLTGKKMEVPVRKIIMGVPMEKAANQDAMANPTSLDYFKDFSETQLKQIISK